MSILRETELSFVFEHDLNNGWITFMCVLHTFLLTKGILLGVLYMCDETLKTYENF